MLYLVAVLVAVFLAIGLGILDRLRQIASLLAELTIIERKREQAAGRPPFEWPK